MVAERLVVQGDERRQPVVVDGRERSRVEAVPPLAPDLLVANGAAREGEQVEIVLTAEQRKTIAAAAA